MKSVKLWQSRVYQSMKKSISGGFLPSLAQLCAGLGKRYLQLRTTLTFRETGNVRLVLEAWQTKTLNRSSLVRDLYTIRLTIILSSSQHVFKNFLKTNHQFFSIIIFLSWSKVGILQINLFQKHLFLHQLTHNMTKDCSLNYQLRFLFSHSELYVHIMFWAWNFHEIQWTICRHIVG